MDKKAKFPSWLAPIIGALLPIGMAMVGQYKQDGTILAIWETDPLNLALTVCLGCFGGLIVWGYDLIKKKFGNGFD